MQRATLASLELGPFNFEQPEIDIELPDAQNLDIPLDGILGTAVLHEFEWWFDYDGNRLWILR